MSDDMPSLFDLEDRGASRVSLPGEGRPAPAGASNAASHSIVDPRRSPAPRSLEQARSERDDAMQRVEDHAGEDWNVYARNWLRDYLSTHGEFFPDDVWAAGLREPREARAFGPVVKYAAARGWITKTDRFRQRTRGHATVAAVWRSNLYRKESA